MGKARPYRFEDIPKFSSQQLAMTEGLRAYLSTRPFHPDFKKNICSILKEYTRSRVKIELQGPKVVPADRLAKTFPDEACFVIVGLGAGDEKMLVELDAKLVFFALERLLGGKGVGHPVRRPLTKIEEGVISFLLLRLMQEMVGGLEQGTELGLSLDRFVSQRSDVMRYFESQRQLVVGGVKLAFDDVVGHLRFALPGSLVEQHFSRPVAQSGDTVELDYIRGRLNAVGGLPVVAHLEVARLDLSASDLAGLESGDIILLENHALAANADGIGGEVQLWLGTGQNGSIRAQVYGTRGMGRLKVLEIKVQERVQTTDEGAAMADGGGFDDSVGAEPMNHSSDMSGGFEQAPPVEAAPDAVPGDNLPHTEGLLRDVPAPVIVELGRLAMNSAQVVRLREGQILKLPRGANDPVDLVVNNKLFAKGELIQVDGELGVRLVSVVGS